MKRILKVLKPGFLTVCLVFAMTVIGALTGVEFVPSAYAECTCDPYTDGVMEQQCYAMGGSWDSGTCTCSGGCDPQIAISCSQIGGTFDPSTCTCYPPQSNPCDTIIYMVEVYFYSTCYGSCTGCSEAYICCYADMVYNLYGMGYVYCGQVFYTNYPLGCDYFTYVSECDYLCSC